ncbi:MAG: DUF4835 family protein [Chitinophagales bacterium]|nr:DUF4835 family protein [Chitinophagales bacterium]
MRKLSSLIILFFTLVALHGGELNCSVKIQEPRNLSFDPKIYRTLETALNEFMNSRVWTDEQVLPHERIKCSIIINISGQTSLTDFESDILVQSERPVFNTNYSTRVFNYNDKGVKFSYQEFQNLDYSDNTYYLNLTSLMAYYAYMIIGFDYETFVPNGGEVYFKKAQTLINNIPANEKSKYTGWSQFDGTRNRFILVDNMLNPRFKLYRTALYEYHRNGMDKMYDNTEAALPVIYSSLSLLEKIRNDNPLSMLLVVFFLAKPEELINIYSKAPQTEKTKVVPLLSKLDPQNAEKYQAILKAK